MQAAARSAAPFDPSLFAADLHIVLAECATSGLGTEPVPAPDGSLPPVWELQQAALWPCLLAAHGCACLPEALEAFETGAKTATRAALATHLHATVTAILQGDRTLSQDGAAEAAGAPSVRGGLPPETATMEELLQWLRPSALLGLLQATLLLLRTMRWFYGGCRALFDACLLSIHVRPCVPALCVLIGTPARLFSVASVLAPPCWPAVCPCAALHCDSPAQLVAVSIRPHLLRGASVRAGAPSLMPPPMCGTLFAAQLCRVGHTRAACAGTAVGWGARAAEQHIRPAVRGGHLSGPLGKAAGRHVWLRP